MPAPVLRRLPGIVVEARAPVQPEVLPRMDVAVFVGFAASGPIGLPVALDGAAQFRLVFGGDAPLAWDADAGRTVHAQLGPAVRSFFANGGGRCWVVRVARGAVHNEVPVPGIATRDAAGHTAPLLLRARSAGSWSDGIAVGATLTTQRLSAAAWDAAARALEVVAAAEVRIGAGDLLRLTWRDAHIESYVAVADAVLLGRERQGGGRTRWRVTGSMEAGGEAWFDTVAGPVAESGVAQLAQGSVAAGMVTSAGSPPEPGDRGVAITLAVDAADAPRPGELITARFGPHELLLVVEAVTTEVASASPPAAQVVVRGAGRWTRAAANLPQMPSVELLGLDLWARDEDGRVTRSGGLGMAPGHARHVQQLPDDQAIHGDAAAAVRARWPDVIAPRFAVAGTGGQPLCIPLGVRTRAEHFLRARSRSESPLERDGLATFDIALFGDAELVDSHVRTLLAAAESMRFLRDTTREPTGLHAALAVEEATLIAVPDAVQPGWIPYSADAPPPPLDGPVEPDVADDAFVDCSMLRLDAPILQATVAGAGDVVALTWTAADAAGPFIVQEATRRDWSDMAEAYAGPATSATLPHRAPGAYYYRVRGVGAHPTGWSAGVTVSVLPGGGWRVRRAAEYDSDVLVGVHRLLLRLCAARRDMLAVMSLPEHYREDAAIAHVAELAAAAADPSATVPPLTGEQEALAFGALYHGWLHTRDAGVVRPLAPDGAACGIMARRALERGAWIPPANDLLRGVVALVQPAAAGRWQELQDTQINVVRRQPGGFALMSADTLARDAEVRPINVRRLLILLRRVATRVGARYVFEPNDDTLRRMVQRGFEQLLGDLFGRGAFAGRTPDQAFRVVTDTSINTLNSTDQGRFIVELRVAPSRPLVFMTLRLVQTGERVHVSGA